MQFITREIAKMARIKTNFPQLAMKKLGVDSMAEVDRMRIVREAGVAYPTVVRWMADDVGRFDEMVVARFCIWLKCDIGELLTLVDDDRV